MIKVIEAGLLSSIQDNGRTGYQESGVIQSGVMDTFTLRIANTLVGNNESEGVLELTLTGPTLEFTEDHLIALCGADFSAEIDGAPAPLWRPVVVKKGSTLHMRFSKTGCRGVIAVAGGFDVPDVFGSKSTYLRAGIGGFKGRALDKEDVLPIGDPGKESEATFKRAEESPFTWSVSGAYTESVYSPEFIRVMPGLQFDEFTEESKRTFTNSTYKLSKQSDRMGFRMEGEPLERTTDEDILSEGVAFGTIQVPSDGQPIILLADRQTLGGYPKIGQVASVDLPALIQKKPGESVRFKWITVKEAQLLFKKREQEWQELKWIINKKLKEA
ncbi:5-oxoprolinase subunit C family protein [Jeotgalibacillus aurantiacus]|uniref:5-oxoprolinase subunit C family protein n=1 Tax=Jeotgalibacillus aurantiacus TaxID=2763266 RepID=UPI002221FD03|nr:biotin-dependent carboxyltransferase family protein [Jeotgalibacillus aurantiacus]